jgi:uncharacterized membrane protein YfcA
MDFSWYLIIFSFIAFLYASVGHGGASGYIALMTLLAFQQEQIKSNALFLNLFVSLIAFIQFYRKQEFPLNLFLLLISVSMPAAFIGGMWSLEDKVFKIILGIVLLVPIARLLGLFSKLHFEVKKTNFVIIIIGFIIGLLSGLLGIGGGILLSPLLILLGWCTIKQTAAISSVFIFLNSLSGLLGMSTNSIHLSENIYLILVFTLIGGLLGGYFGSKVFKKQWIEYTLALVLIIACYKLFTT